ncbi:MAG: SDR family NAD(P)-dependent oxidoreductase [Pseudomonadota bacterium]
MTTPSHKDRIVLITGASRGIGRAAALAFAKAGAHVIALARTVGALEELDDEIKAVGATASLIPADLADRAALAQLPAILNERYGRLDALIANAGILGDLSPVPDILPKVWDQAFAINVSANQQLIAGLDPLLKASPAGRFVGLTTGRTHIFAPFWGTYAASKSAFAALVHTYALEMEESSVRVNLLDPGRLRTGMRAKAMPGEDPMTLRTPEDLAPLILEMAHPDETRHNEVVNF